MIEVGEGGGVGKKAVVMAKWREEERKLVGGTNREESLLPSWRKIRF